MYQNIFYKLNGGKENLTLRLKHAQNAALSRHKKLKVSLIKSLACQVHAGLFMSVSLLLTASLHLTHKINPRLTLHTSIRSAAITLTYKAAHQWVSGRRLPWQHIPSRAAAWSIWDVMLLNQLSLYPALVLVRHYMKTENGTIQTSSSHRLSWLVGCRGHLFFHQDIALCKQYEPKEIS